MGCRFEDARGGLFVVALAEEYEGGPWCWPSDDRPAAGWCVCAGDAGCHLTVVAGPFEHRSYAEAAASSAKPIA